MGFNFAVQQGGGSGKHIKIKAKCDHCTIEKWVRKSWALAKSKNSGTIYICGKCSAKNNLPTKGKEKTMDEKTINEFVGLCETVYVNGWDDKHPSYVARNLGQFDIWYWIELSQRVVAEFIASILGQKEISHHIDQIIYYIEDGVDIDTLFSLNEMDDILKAFAIIRLEELPLPDYLIAES